MNNVAMAGGHFNVQRDGENQVRVHLTRDAGDLSITLWLSVEAAAAVGEAFLDAASEARHPFSCPHCRKVGRHTAACLFRPGETVYGVFENFGVGHPNNAMVNTFSTRAAAVQNARERNAARSVMMQSFVAYEVVEFEEPVAAPAALSPAGEPAAALSESPPAPGA